jgi:transposase
MRPYRVLEHLIEYKARVRGLPLPRHVAPIDTSKMCSACGHLEDGNIREQARAGPEGDFSCDVCGFSTSHRRNAADVIALKGAWLNQLPKSEQALDTREALQHYIHDVARQRRGASGV